MATLSGYQNIPNSASKLASRDTGPTLPSRNDSVIYTGKDMGESASTSNGDLDFFDFDNASHSLPSNKPSQTFGMTGRPTDDQGPSASRQGSAKMRSPPQRSPGTIDDGSPDHHLSRLLYEHTENAKQKHGQITPPDDWTPDSSDRIPRGNGLGHDGGRVSSAPLDFSERGRRAANARHASSRRQKNDETSGSRFIKAEEEGEGLKKEMYREKNRVAAAKCRAKKKTAVDGLEQTGRYHSSMNTHLKIELKALRDELSSLRNMALQHTDCSCHALQSYNMRQAHNLAAAESKSWNAMMADPSRPKSSPTSNHASSTSPQQNNRSQSFSGGIGTSLTMSHFDRLSYPFSEMGILQLPHAGLRLQSFSGSSIASSAMEAHDCARSQPFAFSSNIGAFAPATPMLCGPTFGADLVQVGKTDQEEEDMEC
ncbi:hypothetical protein LTR66_009692 [Elasticomyces elasticus]|nr:hypothetical protein LTR66_009692 [Elasticomyces elasticus]